MLEVEVLNIYQTRNGAVLGSIEVIPDPKLKSGERMMQGGRIFVSVNDYGKIKKKKRGRTMTRFIARLRENVKNRPIVKANIVLPDDELNQSS